MLITPLPYMDSGVFRTKSINRIKRWAHRCGYIAKQRFLPFAPVLTCKFLVIFSLTQCRAPQKIPLTTFDVDVGYTPGKVANLLG